MDEKQAVVGSHGAETIDSLGPQYFGGPSVTVLIGMLFRLHKKGPRAQANRGTPPATPTQPLLVKDVLMFMVPFFDQRWCKLHGFI